jgi:hypothetical protein
VAVVGGLVVLIGGRVVVLRVEAVVIGTAVVVAETLNSIGALADTPPTLAFMKHWLVHVVV